jgi:hypothetical protein
VGSWLTTTSTPVRKGKVLQLSTDVIVSRETVEILFESEHTKGLAVGPKRNGRIAFFEAVHRGPRNSDAFRKEHRRQTPSEPGKANPVA